jgi:hypothetical protein
MGMLEKVGAGFIDESVRADQCGECGIVKNVVMCKLNEAMTIWEFGNKNSVCGT